MGEDLPLSARTDGLRARKKRLMRQQLVSTAVRLFLERGFDGVTVSEIAAACDVSVKTVFNYFPSKESLIFERWEATAASLRARLAEPGISPLEATLQSLDDELDDLTSWIERQEDPDRAITQVQRYDAMIQASASLRAQHSEVMNQIIDVAATALALGADLDAEDPEPQIAAVALLGLWQIQFQSLVRNLRSGRTAEQIRQAVNADVRRASQFVGIGLVSLDRTRPHATSPDSAWASSCQPAARPSRVSNTNDGGHSDTRA
jgi:AcrR family transcriptional regulator